MNLESVAREPLAIEIHLGKPETPASVRRDDRGDLAQGRTTHAMRQAGQPPPVVIGEPHAPSAELPPEQTVVFDQIRKCRPLAGD